MKRLFCGVVAVAALVLLFLFLGNTLTAEPFTNKFGISYAKCMVKGCRERIASSGDTPCCEAHSQKCVSCGCYIDATGTVCEACFPEYLSKIDNPYKDLSALISASLKPTFTNKYGTPHTKCNVSDCDNRIASSGDTNCCIKHSNKCAECHCYIDGDAIWCMDCMENALIG